MYLPIIGTINLSNIKIYLYFEKHISIDEYKYVELHNITEFEIKEKKQSILIIITTDDTKLKITNPKNFEIQKYDNLTNYIITI